MKKAIALAEMVIEDLRKQGTAAHDHQQYERRDNINSQIVGANRVLCAIRGNKSFTKSPAIEPEIYMKRQVIGTLDDKPVWEYVECAEDDEGAIAFYTKDQILK